MAIISLIFGSKFAQVHPVSDNWFIMYKIYSLFYYILYIILLLYYYILLYIILYYKILWDIMRYKYIMRYYEIYLDIYCIYIY